MADRLLRWYAIFAVAAFFLSLGLTCSQAFSRQIIGSYLTIFLQGGLGFVLAVAAVDELLVRLHVIQKPEPPKNTDSPFDYGACETIRPLWIRNCPSAKRAFLSRPMQMSPTSPLRRSGTSQSQLGQLPLTEDDRVPPSGVSEQEASRLRSALIIAP
jgi:hypothetical protein